MRHLNLIPVLILLLLPACSGPQRTESTTPSPQGLWTDARYFNMTVFGHFESLYIQENGDTQYRTGGRLMTYVYSGHMDFKDDGWVDVSFDKVRIESDTFDMLDEIARKQGHEAEPREFDLDYQSRLRWAIDGGGWLMFKYGGGNVEELFDDPGNGMAKYYERINLSLYKPW